MPETGAKMKTIKKLSLAVVCIMFLIGEGVSQTRWKLVAFDADSKPYYVDESLQSQSDGNIIGWKKVELPSRLNYPVGAYAVIKTEWNCYARMSRALQCFI